MNAAEHLARVVADGEIPFVSGLPGTTVLEPLDSLREVGVRFVATRHEQSAVHMADAVGRLSGGVGIAVVDIGPGVANTLSAVLAAHRDSSPVVVIAGTEERRLLGREVWHEMDDVAVFGPVTRRAARVARSEDFPAQLAATVVAATTGRPGPALLSVPKDVWTEPVGASAAVPALVSPGQRPAPTSEQIEASIALLRDAKRPALLLGSGVLRSGAGELATTLAARYDLPVATSPNGRGSLSERHPCCAGVAGRFGTRSASTALDRADTILVVGCRLSDLTTDGWSLLHDQHVIHVDTDAGEIGRNWPVDVGVVADAGRYLSALIGELGDWPVNDHWSGAEVAADRVGERCAFLGLRDADRVLPQHLIGQLLAGAPEAHRVLMGSGRHQQFVGEWPVDGPGQLLYAANSGAMGFALPAAIAAHLLDPGTASLCCLGDGDLMMSCHELETAVRVSAPVKVVVLNDVSYGAIRERQRHPVGTEFSNTDLVALAGSFGIPARLVAHGGEIDDAVTWLWAQDGPCLLDVRIDRNERRTLMHGHDIGTPFVVDGAAPGGLPAEDAISSCPVPIRSSL